jgi:DNA transposition AAA+ family ATPase
MPVFQTEGQRRILAVLDATVKDREFSLIVGPSGVGKTYTVEQFIANAKNNIVYFKITKLMSAGEILKQLCETMGVPSYGTNGAKLKRLKEKAKEIDMLVVDEVDLLVEQDRPKYFLRKIEIFRELADVTAVVLVGLIELDEAIYENAKTYVYSRLGYYARVQEPTAEELWEFAKHRGVTAKEVISGAMGRGFFRFIDKVAKKAREIGEEFAVALMYMGRRG